MRLTGGGIRELDWHQAAEWAIMTYGSCRVTVLDTMGRPYVADVKEGDLRDFPAGHPHSVQGLGPDGCEFLSCFDGGDASEFNSLFVTDRVCHTAPERRRMAVLYQGQGTDDGVQYRPECDDDGLQCWRHRLRQEKSRALCRECRRHGSGVYRGLQGTPV